MQKDLEERTRRASILKNIKLSATTEYLREVILPALVYCIIAGVFTGLLITLYGWGARWIIDKSAWIYGEVRLHPEYVPLFFMGLAALGLLLALLTDKIPEVKGSGIPRTEGILRGLLTFRWLRVIVGTVIGSYLSFLGGLSLGNEGPSVQLGAAAAEGANAVMKSKFAWRRYVSTGGAAAGIGVAFGAPITGIMFAIEEIQKQFNPLLLFSAVVTTLTATLTSVACSAFVSYPEFFFNFVTQLQSIPLKSSWMLVIIAILCGLAAVSFNALLIRRQAVALDNKTIHYIRIVLIFVFSGAAGLLFIGSSGPGFELIERIATGDVALKTLLVLLTVKVILTLSAFRSKATGGLFLPMLTLGAIVGGLLGKLCTVMGLPEEYYTSVVMICTAAFLGAAIRTPFTALILLIETTHSISGFLSAAIVVFVAYTVAEICMRKPLYDKLLEEEISAFNKDRPLSYCVFDKTVIEDCFAEKKYIRNVLWPNNCRIATLTRNGEEIVPDGKTQLIAGDVLHIRCDCYDKEDTEKQLNGLLYCMKKKKTKLQRPEQE